MKDPRELTAQDIKLYATAMESIKARTNAALAFLAVQPQTREWVEAAALQMRLALEELALSSLVPNRYAANEVAAAFAKKDHTEALKLVRQVNPQFWPRPTSQIHDEKGKVVEWADVEDGYLREEDYGRTFGRLSECLHARNFYGRQRPLKEAAEVAATAATQLINLLNHHQVQLLYKSDLLVCVMQGKEDGGRVSVYRFVKVEPEPPR